MTTEIEMTGEQLLVLYLDLVEDHQRLKRQLRDVAEEVPGELARLRRLEATIVDVMGEWWELH